MKVLKNYKKKKEKRKKEKRKKEKKKKEKRKKEKRKKKNLFTVLIYSVSLKKMENKNPGGGRVRTTSK